MRLRRYRRRRRTPTWVFTFRRMSPVFISWYSHVLPFMYFEDSEQFKPLVIYPPTHNHMCNETTFELLHWSHSQSWCISCPFHLSDSLLTQSIKRHIKDIPSITSWSDISPKQHLTSQSDNLTSRLWYIWHRKDSLHELATIPKENTYLNLANPRLPIHTPLQLPNLNRPSHMQCPPNPTPTSPRYPSEPHHFRKSTIR